MQELREILALKSGEEADKSLVAPPRIDDKIADLEKSNKLQLIQYIGDDIVRSKLESMYWQCVLNDKEARKKHIAEEMERLSKEMQHLDEASDD